jgi:hypothetical protein
MDIDIKIKHNRSFSGKLAQWSHLVAACVPLVKKRLYFRQRISVYTLNSYEKEDKRIGYK